jgi:hypothetical protein
MCWWWSEQNCNITYYRAGGSKQSGRNWKLIGSATITLLTRAIVWKKLGSLKRLLRNSLTRWFLNWTGLKVPCYHFKSNIVWMLYVPGKPRAKGLILRITLLGDNRTLRPCGRASGHWGGLDLSPLSALFCSLAFDMSRFAPLRVPTVMCCFITSPKQCDQLILDWNFQNCGPEWTFVL